MAPIFVATACLGSACAGFTGLTVPPPHLRAADPGARPGGTLSVGIEAPASIDPGNAWDPNGSLIASLVCEPLLQLDPFTGRLAGGMVDSVIVSGNGSVITLDLRPNVRFQDGKTVTAQDVVYALSRVARNDYASAVSDVLKPVAGFDEIHAPLPPTDNMDPSQRVIAGVHALSTQAVQITLNDREADFVRALTLPLSAPVPQYLPDRDPGFASKPVCAGPYELVHPYRQGDALIEVRRFRGFYGSDSAYVRAGTGYPDRIDFHIEPSAEAEVSDFKAGLLDIAQVAPEQLAAARTLGPELMMTPTPQVEFLGLSSHQPLLADPRVRSLLSRSIDRGQLVQRVYGGGRAAADRFFPPSLTTAPAPPECGKNVPTSAPTQLDAGDAVLVDQLRGHNYQLYVNDDFQNKAMAENVASQWRQRLGLNVQVVPLSWTQYIKQAISPTGIEGMFRESWQPAYPSLDAFVYPLFDAHGIGLDNFARYDDFAFDHRLEKVARRETDDRLRELQYLSLEPILCRDLPLIPLTFGEASYLVRTDRVAAASEGFFDISTGQPDLREIYLRSVP